MSSTIGTEPAANLMAESGSIAARLTFWYALLSFVVITSAGSVLVGRWRNACARKTTSCW